MKRDIVIPYKLSKSGELEYAIKSCKNLKHGRIIVVGDKPELEVEHAKPFIVRWGMLSAHHDVINKLSYIIGTKLTDEFILMNDDFFVMQPTDLRTYHRGTLANHIASRRLNDNYTKTLVKTYDYLKSIGIEEPLSYELHTPMVLNKHKLREMYEAIVPLISHSSVMLTRSLYGNIYKIGGDFMDDVKNPTVPIGMMFISSSDATFKGELGEYIRSNL